MAQATYGTTTPAVRRNDLKLYDVRDGEICVSHVRVREGTTFTEAEHTNTRLPLECLTLFDGAGTVAVDGLTDEEREWVTAEAAARSNAIEFDEGWV